MGTHPGNAVIRCQCEEKALPRAAFWEQFYDANTEWPYAKDGHEPHACRCVHGLMKYWRNGKQLWLCSCCKLDTDTLINEGNEHESQTIGHTCVGSVPQ